MHELLNAIENLLRKATPDQLRLIYIFARRIIR